jgi:hypothetical protein
MRIWVHPRTLEVELLMIAAKIKNGPDSNPEMWPRAVQGVHHNRKGLGSQV